MDMPNPSPEHLWLQRLVGNWSVESECFLGPDQPPMQTTGTERVRSLGDLWTIGEGKIGANTESGSAEDCNAIMTLGYDPLTKRFVGTFIASMMTHLWSYNGSLDATGQVLTLDTVGPSFADDGTMAPYQDIIEFVDSDHRTLRSQMRGPDGQWTQFMSAHYRRKI
jgi:hypothetical protein